MHNAWLSTAKEAAQVAACLPPHVREPPGREAVVRTCLQVRCHERQATLMPPTGWAAGLEGGFEFTSSLEQRGMVITLTSLKAREGLFQAHEVLHGCVVPCICGAGTRGRALSTSSAVTAWAVGLEHELPSLVMLKDIRRARFHAHSDDSCC